MDDGSRSVDQSVLVLARMAGLGVTGLCLTPHLLASHAVRGVPPAHQVAFEALRPRVPPGIAVYRGAEVMLDRPLDASVAHDRVVTLNGSRYLLVEFPRMVAAQTVEHALALVVAIGLVPLVAHPERYKVCSPRTARRWRSLGALLQVDGPTLLSPRSRGERARELVAHGLADIAAGDNHGDDRSLAPLREELQAEGGGLQADLLLGANPAAILADQSVAPVPPFTWRLSFLKRLRDIFGGSEGERT